MGIFSKKRVDGTLVRSGDPMMHVMPYIMQGRNESAIYYRASVPLENMQNYIRKRRRKGERITLFNLILTATLHLIHLRPHLNRFVAGRRLYDHNSFDVLFVTKTSMSDEGNESVARVSFTKTDNIDSIKQKIDEAVEAIRAIELKSDDKLIQYCAKMPRWFLRAFASTLRFLDFHGLLSANLINMIPMFSSIFVSHLGSIGGDSPFHHLYEFGTISIFMTIGKVYRKPVQDRNGSLKWERTIDLCFTIDERICDGYYLIKSLNIFDDLLQIPELLEYSPEALEKMTEDEMRDLKKSIKEANKGETESLDDERAERIAKRQHELHKEPY